MARSRLDAGQPRHAGLDPQACRPPRRGSRPPGAPGFLRSCRRVGGRFGGLSERRQGEGADTAAGTTSSYLYAPDGSLLIQRDPATNQAIAYLPYGEEIHLNTTTNSVSGLRFYTASPDGVVIVRSSASTETYELTDTLKTGTATVNASSMAVTRRYMDPYGQARGTAPTAWPDQHGYLNQPTDPTTSLSLLGARQYDPVTGRFLTVDPILETGDHRQMNGYSYAADNPVNRSDPSGLTSCDITGNCGTKTGVNTPTLQHDNSSGGCTSAIPGCEGYIDPNESGNGGPSTATCNLSCELAHHTHGTAVVLGSYVAINVNDPNLSTYKQMWTAEIAQDPNALDLIAKFGDRPDIEAMMWLNACHSSQACGADFIRRMIGLYNGLGSAVPHSNASYLSTNSSGSEALSTSFGVLAVAAVVGTVSAGSGDISKQAIHGELRQSQRVSAGEIWNHPDSEMYFQEDGQIVKVLSQGKGFNTVVIRNPAAEPGTYTTVMTDYTDEAIAAKLASKDWFE